MPARGRGRQPGDGSLGLVHRTVAAGVAERGRHLRLRGQVPPGHGAEAPSGRRCPQPRTSRSLLSEGSGRRGQHPVATNTPAAASSPAAASTTTAAITHGGPRGGPQPARRLYRGETTRHSSVTEPDCCCRPAGWMVFSFHDFVPLLGSRPEHALWAAW
jgi:hypothetical protein